MRKLLLCASITAALLALSANSYSATRDLVFEDEETTVESTDANVEVIGVKTTVLLERDGVKSNVAPSSEFKSGDKVKLVFTPNIDGYVYWLAKGSSGSYAMLYPNAKAGMNNEVKRNVEYTVPARGAFRFDNTPGNEELLCILSPTRLSDLDTAAQNQFKDATAQIDALQEQNQSKRDTRDLVFEDEEEDEINTVQQTAPKGEPFVAKFVLKHN